VTAAHERIHAERKRQIEAEGWSPEHDDAHADGELMAAGMCYFLHAVGKLTYTKPFIHDDVSPQRAYRDVRPMAWPWEVRWWKPSTPIRDLEKAGGLFLAEKARLERAGLPFHHVDHKLGLVTEALNRELARATRTDGGSDADGR
jgi:hypothetical protein